MSGQDMILCEIIPLEDLETWIYFGFILCYNKFSQGKSTIFHGIHSNQHFTSQSEPI